MSNSLPMNVKCLALRYRAIVKCELYKAFAWAEFHYHDWVAYTGAHYNEVRVPKPDKYLELEFLFRGFKPKASYKKHSGFNYIESNCPINGTYYIYPEKFVRGHYVNNWLKYPNVYYMHDCIGIMGFTRVDLLYS